MTASPIPDTADLRGRVDYRLQGAVAIITLAHPSTRNALSCRMATDLTEALKRGQREARVILLTGDGDAFCSGANLFDDEAMGVGEGDDDAGRVLETHFNPLIRTARDLRVPLVTALRGPVAGFGVSLALCGDMVVAASSAFFRMAFCSVGLIPDGGLTYMLVRTLGRIRTLQLMMTDQRLPATLAADWGLVTMVVPDEEFEQAALGVAERLAAGPTSTYGAIRRMAWVAMEQSFEQELLLERSLQRSIVLKPDFREGIAAFREKRAARFSG